MDTNTSQNYGAKAPLSSTINWKDINFPPFYRVVHFSLYELQGGVKRFAFKAYLGFIIILSVLLINGIV